MKIYTLILVALSLFSQAACSDQSAESYFKDGLWALNNDDVKGAIKNYKVAIEIKPNYHEVRHRLAFILIEEKKLDEAKFHCDYLIENNALEFSPHYCIGLIHFENNSFKAAANFLEKQMKFDPGSVGPSIWLAKAYIKLKRFEDAEKSLLHEKSREDYDIEYNRLMGEILLGQGDDKKAQVFLSRAKSLYREYSK